MTEPLHGSPVDLVVHARWVVPIEPAGALDHHAVVVDRGRIVAVVPSSEARSRYAARSVVERPTHVLMPGLVNAHAHSAMSLMRGIADDLPLRVWLEEGIWPREARHVSPEFVRDGTLLACAEMLAGGVTTVNEMYFYPDAIARACDDAGIRAVVGLPVLDFATPYAADADGYLEAGLAARDAWKKTPRISFSLAPHAPYTVGDATFARIVTYARQLDLPIQTHVQETRSETDEAIARDGVSPIARLDRLGVTGPGFVAIHAVHPVAGDLERLSAQGCGVVHCPASNLKLASGIAPIARYLDAGIPVGLGTDGAASNNRLDVFAEMRLASLLAKAATGDASAIPAASALAMATIGGARVLGLDAQVGSLVPGKQADMVAVDFSSCATSPCYDPVSHLVHAAGREQVTDVWIDGEARLADRALARLDAPTIAARAAVWRERLA
jgi:5-methylthioadenosine/S-adenosylhomocysteine deaminase